MVVICGGGAGKFLTGSAVEDRRLGFFYDGVGHLKRV